MKRKTNRILSLLLALIMCVGVLTACGGGDTPAQKAPPPPPHTAPEKTPHTHPSDPSDTHTPHIAQ
ncbi:MAG: hypothetical protein K2P37_09365, partial [Oscillospiraceae bacterium]|nr:hypothetical protein [Oscillospiraceae bacterium]